MQEAVILSQRDIERFRKAVERLTAIGESLLANKNGDEPETKVRRRRRRKKAVEESDAVPD